MKRLVQVEMLLGYILMVVYAAILFVFVQKFLNKLIDNLHSNKE